MDDPTELTAGQMKVLVDKAAEALALLTDQSIALYVVNAVLLRALHQASYADMTVISAEASRVAANLSPGVLEHIKALTSVNTPPTPPDRPRLILIEGGKVVG